MNLVSATPQCILAKVSHHPFCLIDSIVIYWVMILDLSGHTDLLAGNGPPDVDEDLDICGNEPPITSHSPGDREKSTLPKSSSGSSSCSSSGESGSSSSGQYELAFFNF